MDKVKSRKAKKKMKKVQLSSRVAYSGDLSSEENVSSREGSVSSQEDEHSDRVRSLHIMQCCKMKTIFLPIMTDLLLLLAKHH